LRDAQETKIAKTLEKEVGEEKFQKMPYQTKMGPPTLRAKDLDRMLEFYEGIFGLEGKNRIRN
jgi:catechol-2,3-dioxygenase